MSHHFVTMKRGAVILLMGLFIVACNLSSETPAPSSAVSHLWVVAMTGSDANDCRTADRACRTILEALDRAADGDAIQIGPGTYEEVSFTSDTAIYINKNITLAGAGSESTMIAAGEPDQSSIIAVASGTEAQVTGVTIIQTNTDALSAVNVGGTLTLDDVTVRHSTTPGVINSGNLTIRNSIIRANGGYGIRNTADGYLRMVGSSVSENIDSGLYNDAVAQIDDSTFYDNQSSGIDNFDNGQLFLSASTISGNYGKGLHNQGIAVLVNTTVSGTRIGGTSLAPGTGIYTTGAGGNLILNLTTIANNNGYGLIFEAGELRLQNSLISNNAGEDCGYGVGTLLFAYSLARSGNNLDSDGSCFGPRRTGAGGDMFLGPLADNGGLTQTHALLEGHPAIDSAGTCRIDTDQRGISRPIGGGCDIGAYEYTFAVSAVEQTATPGLIPLMTDTPTPTEAPPGVKAFKNTNCRYGPGVVYDVADTLFLDQSALVIGRNEEASWFQIKGPVTGTKCWVSLASVDVTGPVAKVPVVVVDAPPTPKEVIPSGCLVYNQQQQAVCVAPCPPNAQPGGACTP